MAGEGRPARVALVLAGVLVATATTGCSSGQGSQRGETVDSAEAASGQTSSPQRMSAQTASRESPGARRPVVLSKANTACLQARVGGAALGAAPPAERSMAQQARRMRVHARTSLPVATRTLAVLQTLRTPTGTRAALARLDSEYVRLSDLYQQAAGPRRQRAHRLAETLGALEDSVRAQARAAGLPACAP